MYILEPLRLLYRIGSNLKKHLQFSSAKISQILKKFKRFSLEKFRSLFKLYRFIGELIMLIDLFICAFKVE